MIADKNTNIPADIATTKDNIPQKPDSSGSIYERRFMIYERMKPSVKAIDFIIIFCVILLFVFFILGVYFK